jgi:hypothetical protein
MDKVGVYVGRRVNTWDDAWAIKKTQHYGQYREI